MIAGLFNLYNAYGTNYNYNVRITNNQVSDGEGLFNGSNCVVKKNIIKLAQTHCTKEQQLIIGYLIGGVFDVGNDFADESCNEDGILAGDLCTALLKYFNPDDHAEKNKRLACIQTKMIQKFPGHDDIFKELFSYTFESFLLCINCDDTYYENSYVFRNLESIKLDRLGFQPDFIYEPKRLVRNNSGVYIIQVYSASHISSSFSITGYKTYSSNNPVKILDESEDGAIGINHNMIQVDFRNGDNSVNLGVTIHTCGSYRINNTDTKHDAMELLNLIMGDNHNRSIIDIRFLKSFGHDMEIYDNHVSVMRFATTFPDSNINYIPLWLNSQGMGTSFLANSADHDMAYLELIKLMDTFRLDSFDTSYQSYIEHIKTSINDLVADNKFEERGGSRIIFSLLVILVAMLPNSQQPILLCGCMSAKYRTMAFIFCALIISQLFFDRAMQDAINENIAELFSFIDSDGRLIRGSLNNEELNLIKAQLNNPILYNVLSRLGIGEYNNKNLDIIEGFLANSPDLASLIITKSLIKTGA